MAHSPASGPSHTLNGRVWGKLCHRQRPGFTRTQILHRTTIRLAKMNLAIRGIDAQIEFGDSFRNDRHPDLRADYILANPPFNISEWNGDHLRDDKRWVHGIPPVENYTRSGGKGQAAFNKADAIAVMLEKYEVCCGMFHGFDWSPWVNGGAQGKLSILPPAQEHILAQEDGKERYLQAVMELTRAFTLSVPDEEAIRIRDDVNFFQTVRAAILKKAPSEQRTEEDLDSAIRQIVSRAVASEGVVNIFAEAGLRNPDISVLSDDFLSEVRGMPHRNLAVELLQKLIRGELSTRRRQNVVQARSFAGMLEDAIRRYQNRTIEAAQVIEELIGLAKEMREDFARGEELGLNEDELAFYDALETNDSAVKVLGDETLRTIAQELVETVRRNATIDWTVGESSCEWAAWFKAQHEGSSWARAPADFDQAGWLMDHTALLNEQREVWEKQGCSVLTEAQNSFTLRGSSASLAGKPDLVAQRRDGVTVIDAKSGRPSPHHAIQVMIYMYALPRALERYSGLALSGQVAYPDHVVDIPAAAVDEGFIRNLGGLIRRLAAETSARRVPSPMECRFCEITKADCPDRLEEVPAQEGVTDDF